MYEDGFCPDVPGPDDESRYACPYFTHNPLHWPWEPGFEDAVQGIIRDTLVRPAFFRTHAIPTGINSAARHVVGEETTPCPYCRQRFRNPEALKLHVEQSHSAEFEWMWAEPPPPLTPAQQESLDKQRMDNELTPAQQKKLDERIKQETERLREKYLRELLES
jgi:hypothetical protein